MAKGSPALCSFNAGELSPWMQARIDFEKYASGAHLMSNFFAMTEGPAMRRPGTRFVAAVKNSSVRSWIRPFQFSVSQAYIIEFGDAYCRFYTLEGQLLQPSGVPAYDPGASYAQGDLASFAVGGTPFNFYCTNPTSPGTAPTNQNYWYQEPASGVYEIPSPYVGADLTTAQGTCALQLQQSADVLYIAGGNAGSGYPPYTLTRLGDTNWVFQQFIPHDGPFIEQNTTNTTITASATTGTIELSASAPIFATTDVGRLVRLSVQNFVVAPWETAIAGVVTGSMMSSNGHTYVAQNDGKTGTFAPEHIEGTAFDGQTSTGVNWLYLDSNYGICRIIQFYDTSHVQAVIVVDPNNGLNDVPENVVAAGTRHWSLGAWSESTEWPRAVAFYDDRLFWAGQVRWWASVPDLFTSYTPDQFGQTTDDSGMAGIIESQDVNNILWMTPANLLLIGTEGGEYGLGPITTVNPLGPDNVHVVRQSQERCRPISPLYIKSEVVYVQRAGRRLEVMDYNFYFDRYDSSDQNEYAYHITQTGLCEIAYCAEPFKLIWGTRNDGLLVSYTYNRQQNVTGWARSPVGGNAIVESLAVIPAPDGLRDQLWLICNRQVQGQTVRYVEFVEKQYEEGDLQSSCFYLDSGSTFSAAASTNGVPQQTITGLNYLDGQTVAVLKDGAVHPACTVIAGAISLQSPGSVVQVGLPCPARLVTMRIETRADVGTSQGKRKWARQAVVRLVDSFGGMIGVYGAKALQQIRQNFPLASLDVPGAIYSGDTRTTPPASADIDTDLRLEITQCDPLPMCVAGLFPQTDCEEWAGAK